MSMMVHNGTGWEPWAEETGGGGGPDLTGLVDRSATDLDLSGLGDTGSIGTYAFYNCTSLTSLTLPAGMTGSISSYAFRNCSALEYLMLRSTSVVALSSTLALQGTTCLIYVPADLVDAYKTAANWSTLAARIHPIPEALL